MVPQVATILMPRTARCVTKKVHAMPDESPLDFAALLAASRNGDPLAMTQLCEQYESKVRTVARVLLGPALRPHLDSTDLLQSVHRTLMIGLRDDKFDISTPEKLVALTTTIVRRKVARQWRRVRRQQRLTDTFSDASDLPSLFDALSSPEHDPALAAQWKDEVGHLCRQLNDTERRILELRSFGYTTAEIAEQLGLQHVTLRVRLTRLRERLRSAGVVNEWL